MPEPIDAKALRKAFASFMTGVTVVTARTQSGDIIGFTANSFTSVSLKPPLLAVCPGQHLSSYSVFEEITHFAVNILAEGQEHISNTFATAGDDRFSSIDIQLDAQGIPLIVDACAMFSCAVHQRHDAGDHMILVGEVLSYKHTHSRGLGYCHTGYFSLSQEQRSDSVVHPEHKAKAGAIVEFDDHVLVMESSQGMCLPVVDQLNGAGARSTLQSQFESLGLRITLGPVYSSFVNTITGYRYTYFRAHAHSSDHGDLGDFRPINTLPDLPFRDAAETTMIQRFVTEHENQLFGLYLGNDTSGEVHTPNSE